MRHDRRPARGGRRSGFLRRGPLFGHHSSGERAATTGGGSPRGALVKRVWIPVLLVGALAVSFVAGSRYGRKTQAELSGTRPRTILYYRDPMQPSYTSDRPGKSPTCGMDLEPVYADQ